MKNRPVQAGFFISTLPIRLGHKMLHSAYSFRPCLAFLVFTSVTDLPGAT